MKKTTLAVVALVALASCAKENSATQPTSDQVAARFAAASISRVADNAWEVNDKIGISMTVNGSTTLADGSYENVPHTVGAAGDSGTFTPDGTIIYFPVDGSSVDFYAYYPYSTLDADKNIAVSVATQSFSDIDIVATKAAAKTKDSPTVAFSGTEAFEHQLSKLTLALNAGSGLTSLAGVTTTIKGQNTTAKYNIYSGVISGEGDVAEITALTAADGSTAEAILLPTTGTIGSSIVFTLDGNDYIWDTKDIELIKGNEHTYTVTITRTGVTVSGATIDKWTQNSGGDITASDL